MWRFFNCASRGTRSVRPSQCCTQDNTDDAAKNSYQCVSPGPPVRLQEIVRYQACCKESRDLNWKWLYQRFSKCLFSKNSTPDKTLVNNNNGFSRLPWVWAIPCDVYPHIHSKWKHRHDAEKWRRYLRRRHSLTNIFNWSSGAAITLAFYYWRILYQSRNSNSKQCNTTTNLTHESGVKTDTSSATNLDLSYSENYEGQKGVNQDHYFEDGLNLHVGEKAVPSFNFPLPFHFYCLTGYQNELKVHSKTSLFVNPNASAVISPIVNLQYPVHKQEEDKVLHTQSKNPFCFEDLDIFRDVKPQVEFDREVLETDDSGYLETSGSNSNAGTQEDSLIFNHKAQDSVKEQSSRSFQETTADDFLGESCVTGKPVKKEKFLNNSHHLVLEEPSAELKETENVKDENFLYLHPKEVVLIEDCSSDDDIDRISLGEHCPSKAPSVKVSSARSDVKKASLREFNDGLQEILNAGKRDLNDFSNQLLDILEGGIGHSVVNEEPEVAVDYFRARALLGDAASTFNLALCYHMGQGIEKDLKLARELYEAATLAGHGWATYNLAVMLSEGKGGPADKDRALSLLSKAASMNVKEAQSALQLMEECQNIGNCGDTVSPRTPEVKQRQRLNAVSSAPSLTTVMSQLWSSSYSTSDLEFMEDNDERNIEDLCSFQKDIAKKPSFYIG